jgi:hypothetical protein
MSEYSTGLPVLESISWFGWDKHRAAEQDVFDESAALARAGWSETRWRAWLVRLREEVKTRRQWCEDRHLWVVHHMGSVYDGRNHAEETLMFWMVTSEDSRRLDWNLCMRRDGWGKCPALWWSEWKHLWREVRETLGETMTDEESTAGDDDDVASTCDDIDD